MATDKKSFILYCDLLSVVKKLVLQDRVNKTNYAGELFLHTLEYVNDNNPIPIDFIVEMAFEPIKLQLKRDLQKYERIRVKNSDNAHKRWHKDNATAYDRMPNDAKNADNDTVNDNVNGIDNDIIIINDNLNTNALIVKNPNFVKFEIWITENCPQVAKMKEPFTEAQFLRISKDFSRELIKETIEAMHNKKDLLKKYNSANLTLRSWINLKNQKNGQSTKSEPTDAYDKLSETIRKFGNVD